MLLTVKKCTKSEQTGKFCTTLESSLTKKIGENNSISRVVKFYIFLDNEEKVGNKLDLNLSEFDVVQRDIELVDETTGEAITRKCNYLYMKRD